MNDNDFLNPHVNLQSYKNVIETSTSFIICFILKHNNRTVQCSPLPISELKTWQAYVNVNIIENIPITIWDNTDMSLVSISPAEIETTIFKFVKRG